METKNNKRMLLSKNQKSYIRKRQCNIYLLCRKAAV